MRLEKYSIGVGDRFGRQGEAQLRAFQMAAERGVDVVPVWNKSYREHTIIGTSPADVRREADQAVRARGWTKGYYVDADHIRLGSVDHFIEASDFFTIDIADSIGKRAEEASLKAFVASVAPLRGRLSIPGLPAPVDLNDPLIEGVAARYLFAIQEAATVYRHIVSARGTRPFVTEVSLDEADTPQSPEELLLILAALSRHGIPVQTIAPKFTGAFLKGVDYVGDVEKFRKEFEEDLAVIAFAAANFDLPGNLKLSVHSGSDKFSLYPVIRRAIQKFNAGLHLKTAGTTWLEELIGLAAAGGEGLEFAREVYARSYERYDEMCQPYLSVIHIDRSRLPQPGTVGGWTAEQFVGALRHDQRNPAFNSNLRQLIHIGYKVAAEAGNRYQDLLRRHEEIVSENVLHNIYERHLVPLFIGA